MGRESEWSAGHDPPSHAARFGRFGERCAADWYQRAGYRILARNWRCRQGELDLVVSRGAVVAFVEVKARSSTRFGSGAEAVDWRKQAKVRAVASQWLDVGERYFDELRFDVVDVDRRGSVAVYEDCF
ncbi:MAG: YraN family protein [Acidimicrobiales bacterium]